MEWKENPSIASRMLQVLGKELEEGGRAKPLPHLMELVSCLTKSYRDRTDALPLTPKEIGFFTVGKAVETFLLQKLEEKAVTGIFEGVGYEIDFLMLDGRVGELKSTRIGVKREANTYPERWTKQVTGYMKCKGQTEAVFSVLHIIPVELRSWEVRATQEEIDANWEWVQMRKEQYLGFIDKKEVPEPFQYNEDWECKDCRYKLICDMEASILLTERRKVLDDSSN